MHTPVDNWSELVEQHRLWLAESGGSQLKLNGAAIADIDANGVDLSKAIFEGCQLSSVDLSRATLDQASFVNCTFSQCTLQYASALGTSFIDSYVGDWDTRGLSINAETNFSGVKFYGQWELVDKGSKKWRETESSSYFSPTYQAELVEQATTKSEACLYNTGYVGDEDESCCGVRRVRKIYNCKLFGRVTHLNCRKCLDFEKISEADRRKKPTCAYAGLSDERGVECEHPKLFPHIQPFGKCTPEDCELHAAEKATPAE